MLIETKQYDKQEDQFHVILRCQQQLIVCCRGGLYKCQKEKSTMLSLMFIVADGM